MTKIWIDGRLVLGPLGAWSHTDGVEMLFRTTEGVQSLVVSQDTYASALGELDPRWQRVVEMRFPVLERYGSRRRTLAEIGTEMGVTPQRVSQIAKKALRLLLKRVNPPTSRRVPVGGTATTDLDVS